MDLMSLERFGIEVSFYVLVRHTGRRVLRLMTTRKIKLTLSKGMGKLTKMNGGRLVSQAKEGCWSGELVERKCSGGIEEVFLSKQRMIKEEERQTQSGGIEAVSMRCL